MKHFICSGAGSVPVLCGQCAIDDASVCLSSIGPANSDGVYHGAEELPTS